MTTHLETEDFPAVQQAQASEFLKGPAKGGTIIATGDFNSACGRVDDQLLRPAHAPGKFRDAWDEGQLGPGSSCCQESNTPPLAPGALNNPISTLRTRIDLILTRGAARSDGNEAQLIGDSPVRGDAAALAVGPRRRGRPGSAQRLTGKGLRWAAGS